MSTRRARLGIAVGSAALLAGAGVAAAASQGPSQIAVFPKTMLHVGQTAPFDAPGVQAIRRGKAIPSGYVLVGQKVEVTRGTNAAGAALFFRCPDGKRLRTFGVTGQAGSAAPTDYVGHRQTRVFSFPDPRKSTTSGTVYAVCR